MTKDATQCLLDLLKLILPPNSNLPSTTYLLENSHIHKKSSLCDQKPQDVFFRTNCLEEMTEDVNKRFFCAKCDIHETRQEIKSKGGHYLLLSIESQLRNIFQVNHVYLIITHDSS